MNEPKFKPGQLVKYRVGNQWRYNNIIDSYYNDSVNVLFYRLDEPMALPVYKEDWLHEVSDAEDTWLRQKIAENKLAFSTCGYMYVIGGDVYE